MTIGSWLELVLAKVFRVIWFGLVWFICFLLLFLIDFIKPWVHILFGLTTGGLRRCDTDLFFL